MNGASICFSFLFFWSGVLSLIIAVTVYLSQNNLPCASPICGSRQLMFRHFVTCFGLIPFSSYTIPYLRTPCTDRLTPFGFLCQIVPDMNSVLDSNSRFTYLWSIPPLWSSGQSSWLHIQKSGFDSRLYQIFWEIVELEWGPLSLVSTTEELLERKSRGSGLESREYERRDPSLWPRGTLLNRILVVVHVG
jgi:hypothetical protein